MKYYVASMSCKSSQCQPEFVLGIPETRVSTTLNAKDLLTLATSRLIRPTLQVATLLRCDCGDRSDLGDGKRSQHVETRL